MDELSAPTSLTGTQMMRGAKHRPKCTLSFKKSAFYMLRAMTSQSLRESLKSQIWQFRVKGAPLLRWWYGTYSTLDLEKELRRHIASDFDILMVHCSTNNMFPTYNGDPCQLLQLLARIVGPDRTLAMPAFFFGTPEQFNGAYYRDNPVFHVRQTPSQMGLLTELFRRRPGVARSLHPTHSVCARGPLAHDLTSSHHLSSATFGHLSPFGVMAQYKTIILGMGAEYYRTLTQVHAVEGHLGSAFPIPRETEEPIRVTLIDSNNHRIPYILEPPLSRNFVIKIERLARIMKTGSIREWKYKGTPFYAVSATDINLSLEQAALAGRTLYVPS
jgi:aminoglycoside N3'-acetyltransferase